MQLSNSKLFKTAAYINGEWVKADKTFSVINPATQDVIAEVSDLGEVEAGHAIEAAETAQKLWAQETGKSRAKILRKWFDLITESTDDLAQLITAECGKPLAESAGEVAYGASFVEWFSEEAKRIDGDTIPSPIENARILTIKQPVGVCAAITPWNFPVAMITRKIAPALAAGCSVICKPAADTPLSALALAELAEQAGFPKGVLNVVTSSDSKTIGQTLCESPVVRKLSFTGSTATGKALMKQSAGTLKKLSMELGGNAPFIVFKDADIDSAVDGAIACKFRNAGQTCVCANRFYIHEDVYDEFATKLTEKVKALKVGNGAEEGIDIGPLINEQGMNKVKDLVEDALEKGAEILTGGEPHEAGSQFYTPTVLGNTSKKMRLSCEEIFGPVAPLFKFSSEEEAIELANATEFGLASYFYGRDIGQIWRVAEALEYGMVAINAPILSTEVAPFGGIKESGFGREGSKYGIDEYVELKYILMAGLDK